MQSTFPVIYGICLDAEAIWLGKAPENAQRPVLLSHGAYEIREGLAPLLDLLDRHEIKATFFVPGITADRYPDSIREIQRRGHELASHGHGHKPPATLSRAGGKVRTRARHGIVCEPSPRKAGRMALAILGVCRDRTLDCLLETGITISAHFFDRVRPYRTCATAKPLTAGRAASSMAYLADAPYFMYGGQIGRGRCGTAREVENVARRVRRRLPVAGRVFPSDDARAVDRASGTAGDARPVYFLYSRAAARRFMTCGEVAATVA